MSTENQGHQRPKLGPVPDPAPENDWTTLFDVPTDDASSASDATATPVAPAGVASTTDERSRLPAAPSQRRAKWLFAGVFGLVASVVIGGGVAAVSAVSGLSLIHI